MASLSPSSSPFYFLGKLQTTALLLFSIHFAGMLVTKLAEGVKVPTLTLSNRGRFTAGCEPSAEQDDQVLRL